MFWNERCFFDEEAAGTLVSSDSVCNVPDDLFLLRASLWI